jgi:cytoskeletal protein CcmA (bactofilin family)
MAVVVVVGSRHRHRRPCAVVLVLLLFLALHHCEALTTSTSTSTSTSASRRIRVRRGALLSHESSGEHEPGGDATATVIGKGTSLVVDVMHLGSSLVVHGHLQVKALKLLLQNQLDVVVGESGVLQGDIAGLDTVQVCGMLKGRVHCARLIIDEQGEIIGDVKADLLYVPDILLRRL